MSPWDTSGAALSAGRKCRKFRPSIPIPSPPASDAHLHETVQVPAAFEGGIVIRFAVRRDRSRRRTPVPQDAARWFLFSVVMPFPMTGAYEVGEGIQKFLPTRVTTSRSVAGHPCRGGDPNDLQREAKKLG